MRVLLVTDFYHPYTGGVEIHVRTIASELAARGHAVAVATMATPDGEPERDRDGPVAVHTIGHAARAAGVGATNVARPWAPPAPDPVAMAQLRRVVRSFRPDVIHGHDWLARSVQPRLVSGAVPVVTSLHYYTRTCAKKTLWRTGGSDGAPCPGPALLRCLRCSGAHYGRLKGAAVALALRTGTRLEDRRTSRFVAVSDATATGNGLAGSPAVTVIPNPLPPLAHDGAFLPPAVQEALPDGPFVLYVGDLRPEKGLHVLTAAVERLRDHHRDDTPLVVVGERLTGELPLPARTVELGPLAHDHVQLLWPQATLGVVPSVWPEPFGLVAIEAMAAGCPLVASDIGGLQELLGDRRAALVDPGDPVRLADVIHDLLGDEDARVELAARAAAGVARYAAPRVVDELEDLYRSVTA